MLETSEHINQIFLILFAIALIIIVAVVLLFVTFNNRKNKLVQEQLETKLNNQKRQHKLELNALRAQMNPHFVHNSLNAIQYYIQLNEVEKSEDYLAKFSKLMRLFFEYSRKQTISLENELQLLNKYLEIEKLRFEEGLNYNVEVDTKLDIEDLFLPPMILQPILENAINHGIFHKEGQGILELKCVYVNDTVFKIEVVDNGIGINRARELSKNKKKTHTEHSSFVLEERLLLLKESNNWDIDFTILDRSETQENQTGTRVVLIFKDVENEH
ncbi:histidine kinase [Lacinutrix sp.]|uniref:sensor histidine kinase n=1 Tax=Lacinutrix sp. TaxID=1937692 RepID=UPI0025C4047A|nr:histidine kinase [Lacinutrix sp.]